MDCPIPTAHGRLRELHQLWHQALSNYGDPDSFATNLNAAVQACRNVTFLLQAEKQAVPQFDGWYAEWQGRLRQDPLSLWVADARTIVVHKADLERTSTAVARIHDNRDVFRFKLSVPPTVPTDVIADRLVDLAPPEIRPLLANCLVSVERTWIMATLPDSEVLDALAHVYSELSSLLAEAHVRCGGSLGECNIHHRDAQDHAPPVEGGLPVCMRVTREARTVRVALCDKRRLTQETITGRFDAARDAPALEKHYGKQKQRFQLPEVGDPTPVAMHLVDFAKHILRTDGHHDRMFWLRTDTGEWKFTVVFVADRQQKYAAMRHLAEEVERYRADAIIEIGEVWVVKLPKSGVLSDWPEKIPSRREALVVSVAVLMPEGPRVTRLLTPFSRDKRGRIRFQKTENDDAHLNYLQPVFDVWARQRT